jgi:hypothetical protein
MLEMRHYSRNTFSYQLVQLFFLNTLANGTETDAGVFPDGPIIFIQNVVFEIISQLNNLPKSIKANAVASSPNFLSIK